MWLPVAEPAPVAVGSVTAPADVVPSPQVQTAVCVSVLPSSVKAARSAAGPPIAMGSAGPVIDVIAGGLSMGGTPRVADTERYSGSAPDMSPPKVATTR